MEYQVEIEVTYKYIVAKSIIAKNEADAKKKVEDSLKNFNQRSLENEWDWGDEPSYIGDIKVLSVEEY